MLVSIALLAQGCAGMPSHPGDPAAGTTIHHPRGIFTLQRGRPGLVIGAPHGTSDSHTDLIGLELARRTGWSLVVATGFSHLDADGRRFNVNRPTESVPGTAARLEAESEEARAVHGAYRRHVAEAAQGALALYVEVHGNGRRESAGRIEVATVGVSREEARKLKTLLELVREAHLRGRDGVPRLAVLLEPLDPLHYTASAAKRAGLLGVAGRTLHIELPRVVRAMHREVYSALLADFLSEAAALLAPAVP
jgi:hypothetical protein